MSQKLYIVSSLHYTDEEIDDPIEDILEVRLAVIGAIARSTKGGNFFCDGVADWAAEELNEAMGEPLEKLGAMNRDIFEQGGFQMYDQGRMVALFARLRQDGLNYTYMPTEKESEELNPDQYAFNTLCERIPGMERISRMAESDHFTSRAVVNETRRIRDSVMVENIEQSVSPENILFVGLDHNMAPLLYSELEWYRVNIVHNGRNIQVEGTLPAGLVDLAKNIPIAQSDRTILVNMDYL